MTYAISCSARVGELAEYRSSKLASRRASIKHKRRQARSPTVKSPRRATPPTLPVSPCARRYVEFLEFQSFLGLARPRAEDAGVGGALIDTHSPQREARVPPVQFPSPKENVSCTIAGKSAQHHFLPPKMDLCRIRDPIL
ncbi:hypothetical protein BD310DRAFT_698593 [Dichomitus squalens]|uniref:Uncharacterized protein n=1 Tax=Dichomitus squalens TaxID=114155 RepID=A0A4Q9Q5N0_9APHY|nr:hypothetical protein BD310DRAFT_698593 [Dichomitus squalens]